MPLASATPLRGRIWLAAIAAVMSSALLAACGPSNINTIEGVQIDDQATIIDTPTNREVLDVVSAYHEAIENKDGQMLRSLASADYYENGGTTDRTDDDYGRTGLPDAIGRFTDNVEHIRFEVVVKDIRVEQGRAQVFYEYSFNYLYRVGDVPRWEAGRDVNRMDLVLNESGRWKIVRGL